MKSLFRQLFRFILSPLESGDDPYRIVPSHRYILIAVGVMFAGLCTAIVMFSPEGENGMYIPLAVFGCVSTLTLIVGLLGTDRAVAKIWGSKS